MSAGWYSSLRLPTALAAEEELDAERLACRRCSPGSSAPTATCGGRRRGRARNATPLAAQRAEHAGRRRLAKRRRQRRPLRGRSRSAMSYRPDPPMTPICARCIRVSRLGFGVWDLGFGILRLFELDEHAVRSGGMDEGDQRAFGSWPRLHRRRASRPARFQPRQRGADVVNAQRDVMEAGTALLDVLS